MVNKLPIVKDIDADDDTDFFFDKRLKELRAVRDPFRVVKLNDAEVYYYEHLYNEADRCKIE